MTNASESAGSSPSGSSSSTSLYCHESDDQSDTAPPKTIHEYDNVQLDNSDDSSSEDSQSNVDSCDVENEILNENLVELVDDTDPFLLSVSENEDSNSEENSVVSSLVIYKF